MVGDTETGYGYLRPAAVAAGCAAIAFGLWNLVIVAPSATRPIAAAGWLAGVLATHDGILAPVAAGVGVLLVRLLPGSVRRIVAIGLFVAVCLTIVALPALLTPGVAGNPSATPRNYGQGLAIALAADAVITAVVAVLLVRRHPVGI